MKPFQLDYKSAPLLKGALHALTSIIITIFAEMPLFCLLTITTIICAIIFCTGKWTGIHVPYSVYFFVVLFSSALTATIKYTFGDK